MKYVIILIDDDKNINKDFKVCFELAKNTLKAKHTPAIDSYEFLYFNNTSDAMINVYNLEPSKAVLLGMTGSVNLDVICEGDSTKEIKIRSQLIMRLQDKAKELGHEYTSLKESKLPLNQDNLTDIIEYYDNLITGTVHKDKLKEKYDPIAVFHDMRIAPVGYWEELEGAEGFYNYIKKNNLDVKHFYFITGNLSGHDQGVLERTNAKNLIKAEFGIKEKIKLLGKILQEHLKANQQ